MRILYLNKYNYLKGGSERVFMAEREAMEKRGNPTAVFASRHPQNLKSEYSDYFTEQEDYFQSSLLHKAKAALKIIYSPEAYYNCLKVIDLFKPDLIHAHIIYAQLSTAVLDAAKKRGIPVVMTAHDYKMVCPSYLMLNHGALCEKCFGGSYYQCFLTACHKESRVASAVYTAETYFNHWFRKYDWVKTFLCPSEFMKEKMLDQVPKNKLKLLYNPVDLSHVELGDKNQGYYLFVGRLSKEKGVGTLIQTFRKLKLPLVITGTGPLEAALREAAADSPLIKFTGYQTGKALQELYQGAAACVLPSEWYENLSMVGIEALAYGKPVIGSSIGGIPELIQDGVNGLLFEPFNSADLEAKVRLLQELPAESYGRMCANARGPSLERFSLDRHCDHLMEIYKEALKSS